MGEAVAKVVQAEATCPRLEAHLRTMEAVGMPLHQILPLAEREGMALPALVDYADDYLKRVFWIDAPQDAVVLVFGCVRGWKPLLPLVKRHGVVLLQALLMGRHGRLESLVSVRDTAYFRLFRARVLRRLGYPTCLTQSNRLKVSAPKPLTRVMDWLGGGGPVLANWLDLWGFQATSPSWGALHVPFLHLRNGHSPATIEWRPEYMDPVHWDRIAILHIEGVEGLRHLYGTTYGGVALKDCPDLESLEQPCQALALVDCPRLTRVWVGTHSERLTLKRCAALEAIQPWNQEYPANPNFGSEWIYELEAIDVADCERFRSLPARLHLKKGLQLQGVGPIVDWPWDFQVGGDFLLLDCPEVEVLPPVEVQGSLTVAGVSGLRKLSPGTVIGKNLDLRACAHLEDFPRGVKVGGNIYLPEHLNHRRRHLPIDPMLKCELLEPPSPDLYEDLRGLLKVLRFPALLSSQERLASQGSAEDSLALLKARVAAEPRFESLLLWTASEVWRDLAEEAWGTANPLAEGRKEVDEDLPMAWFLDLVRE